MSSRFKIIRACTVAQSIGFFASMIPELDAMGLDVVALSSPGEEAKMAERYGARFIPVRMERHISPVKDIKSLIRLIKVFKREKPAMVHSMTPKAGLLCMMAAWFTRVPVRIHTFTGLIFPTSKGIKKQILMATDRLTCACATHIIPEGEGVKADLINNHITRKDIKVLGHGNVRGIDLNHFSRSHEIMAQAATIKKEGMVTFIFVGRLVGDKGINELVTAFTRLNQEHPSTRLLLVGPKEQELDPLQANTLATIESHHAIDAVGNQQDVRPWLAAADIFVFPSYREGFPNVVIEAGAMGLPAIVTDINGSREIIIEGRNGSIIPPHDAHALYTAMKRLCIDSKSRTAMGHSARPLIASRFEQSFVRQCLKDFYNEVLQVSK